MYSRVTLATMTQEKKATSGIQQSGKFHNKSNYENTFAPANVVGVFNRWVLVDILQIYHPHEYQLSNAGGDYEH